MSNTTYRVSGLTCGHCAAAVTEELSALDGVERVAVDLHAGEISTVVVEAGRTLDDTEVDAALAEAGAYTRIP